MERGVVTVNYGEYTGSVGGRINMVQGGEEKPSLLDLEFTKKPEPPPSIQYLSPMGRSDHVTLVLEVQEDVITYSEEYKRERLNYAKRVLQLADRWELHCSFLFSHLICSLPALSTDAISSICLEGLAMTAKRLAQ
ncbi:hypothetical protein E2C01_055463 [Portunus trituberculatus]|uniref:Uncharacterized protein n=1 Tax=Portunus trituberculatus TaxID=210409 RepID=A0A5B7GMS6_PORTR|nr:hypothetical protein [Portunus trituberculatus]